MYLSAAAEASSSPFLVRVIDDGAQHESVSPSLVPGSALAKASNPSGPYIVLGNIKCCYFGLFKRCG
jgi:hypothetical protein